MYAGRLVSQGSMNVVAALLVGSVANPVGSWIAWAAGAYGGDHYLVRESGRAHVAQAHHWFERWGSPGVRVSRMLPFVHTFISLPARVARMPLGRFSVLTFLGCLPWCTLLVFAGYQAGTKWDTWHRRIGSVDYLVVAAAATTIRIWALRRMQRTRAV